MKLIVSLCLALVALLHALPALGVLGGERLQALYGVRLDGAGLELLMRHRAVLFGLLAALLAVSAWLPAWRGVGVAAGLVSVVSFLVLAWPMVQAGTLPAPLLTVFRWDLAAAALLLVAAVAQGLSGRSA